MKINRLPLVGAVCLALLFCAVAQAAPKTAIAHYMPWFASKPVSGQWGWHWTMGQKSPDKFHWEGHREGAFHDRPLLGLYDSGDPHLLETQALLMKFAGFDAVMLDWYGTSEFNDYAAIHRNCQKLIPILKKAGLRFAVCYEDQSLGQMVRGNKLEAEGAAAQAKSTLQWLEANWFNDEAYLKINGRPLLHVFGPQYLDAQQWAQAVGGLVSRPLVFALPHLAKTAASEGVFAWPPVTGGKTLTSEMWRKNLEAVYARQNDGVALTAVAFPGFQDYYKQAGVRDSYGYIAHRDGATFAESLDMALQSNAPLLQVATWNDYGEGTQVEPTHGHGYRLLEALQQRAPQWRGAALPFDAADLRLPVQLYQLRKRAHGEAATLAKLDEAAALLFAGQCRKAEVFLDGVRDQLATEAARFFDAPDEADAAYRLKTEVLYRSGELTAVQKQRCRLDVYYPADKKNFATVVWFHGGGLSRGERSVPLALRGQGVAVVTVNYRRAPQAKNPAFIEDAAAAVAWTFSNIEKFGGSPQKVFVSGHSAGAYLTLMLGLDNHWLAARFMSANRIAGLIPLSPQVITHFAIRAERGIPEKLPIIDQFAPLFHIRKDAPPMLLVTGDREEELMGRYEENAYFWRMMKLVGRNDIPLEEMKGADHGNMPVPAFPLLLQFIEKIAAPQ